MRNRGGDSCRVSIEGQSVYVLTPMSSTIILSRPLGPNELFTTLAMACVASTAPVSPSTLSSSSAAVQRTVLVSNIGSGNLLAAQEKGAVPRLLKQGCHDCSCGIIHPTVAALVQTDRCWSTRQKEWWRLKVPESTTSALSPILALAYLSELRSSCNGGTCPACPSTFLSEAHIVPAPAPRPDHEPPHA